jgi:glycerol kinase
MVSLALSPELSLDVNLTLTRRFNRLRDNLGIIDNPKEAGELAEQVDDTGGVYFVTGFGGLFAPYWDMRATCVFSAPSTVNRECSLNSSAKTAV